MSAWLLTLLLTAGGGALLVLYAVARSKHISEELLDKYAEMLADARVAKARELQEAAAKSVAEDAEAEPAE